MKNKVPTTNEEKQGQRGILESRNIRQVHSTIRAEDNCQIRDWRCAFSVNTEYLHFSQFAH